MPSRLEVAQELGLWAAEQIRTHRPSEVEFKAHAADPVSDLDRAIELRVREVVAQHFPEDAISGEEFGSATKNAPVTWFCDPIDGTTNYVNGLGWCSFSLAAQDADGPLLGVLADPWRDFFTAARGQGAFTQAYGTQAYSEQEKSRLKASPATTLAGSVVTTEWAAHVPWPGMLPTLGALADASCTTRIMGSSALSIAQVAAGRAVGCFLANYSAIDDLAAVMAALESGCAVLNRRGGSGLEDSEDGLLVAAPGVAHQLLAAWKR